MKNDNCSWNHLRPEERHCKTCTYRTCEPTEAITSEMAMNLHATEEN